MEKMINNLSKANNAALVMLMTFVLPIGIMCFITIAALVEFFGITMFFSNLLITKTNEYVLKVTAHFQDLKKFAHAIAFFISIIVGVLMSIVVVFSAFYLKMIEKKGWSMVSTFASALMVLTTYYSMFTNGLSTKMSDVMLIFGVLVATFFSSGMVAILSDHLNTLIKELPEFKQMRQQIVGRLSDLKPTHQENRFLL